ncbi:8040_t:CDS:2 [Dentiscutata erythropus]|uniref:8040_t:CDS:1 n=1 Tax=Dentiscutata erythropus TaxID=1348616 RepID=A0A9N9NGX1_9GLOM|nr:8040_t:CDS:2 [Dentiscutata erythropus]
MSFSKITQHFRRTVFPTHFVNRRVRFLQSPSLILGNLRPDLFQSSLSRPYANSSPSPHTSPEESTSSSYLNKFTKYIAKRLPTTILANIIVTGLVGLISVDLMYAWYEENIRALEAFKRASAVYKAKHNKPPVIVYDNIAKLVNVNPKVLDTLQDDAKMNADHRKYIAVFVSSEGSVPRRMESRSAWSRAKKPVMEIGDLNEKESMEYLTKKCKINEVEAKKLYDLVGGRFIELKTVVGDFTAGQSLEDIKNSILNEVEKKFQFAKLLPNDPYYNVGKNIISDLLKSKELSFLAFKKYFNEVKELNEVLESNVFSYHPEKNIVTFQSQSIESYIRENIDIFVNSPPNQRSHRIHDSINREGRTVREE